MKKLLMSVCLIGCLAGAAQAGWEYTAVTRAEGSRGSEAMNQTIKGLVDGDKARFDFVSSGNPILGAGTYMLTRDAGAKVYLVNPKEKSYSLWDMQALAGFAGAMMKPQVVNPKTEKLTEEKGEKMLGYRTTHYRFRNSYTMNMSIMGFNSSSAIVQDQDIWAAPDLKDAAFGFRGMQQGMKTGDANFDKMLADEARKVAGFPLKMVSTQTTKDSRGQTQITKTIMDVTALKEVKASAAQFELPAGYTEKPFLPMGGAEGKPGAGRPPGGSGADNPFLKMMQEKLKSSGGAGSGR
jgi:hypothetical protein